MCEKFMLVEHLSTVSTIIQRTFQTTQRIKLTSFDVSHKYVVFGANSGGIYIFKRDPCQFLKLIPSTHGATHLIAISDNEENLAISVLSGLVVILKDCFSDQLFQQQSFAEHEGHQVTALKWNDNDLFCGDSLGKVSVISFKTFLPKAIFQPSITCVMNLESEIVQIDCFSKFLLVSTVNKSFLCDTETERYRQIGKKGRDGYFGACFFTSDSVVTNQVSLQSRGIFKTITESEVLSLSQINDNHRIFCARPGARLWQANFQGDVIFTHQFRSSFDQSQSDLIHLSENNDCELKITKFPVEKTADFSFGKIFKIADKFIMTFCKSGFYIVNPACSTLVLWSAYFENILDIKIVDSVMYIWHNDLQVSVILIMTVEELILKSLLKKQYRLCGQISVHFIKDLEPLLETSRKIHLISILESKLNDSGDIDLIEKLKAIFERLKIASKVLNLVEHLKNGIVVVNNVYISESQDKNSLLPESVEHFNAQKAKKDTNSILAEQYRVSKIYKTLETTDFKNLLCSFSPNQMYEALDEFKSCGSDSDSEYWRKELYLKYLENSLVDVTTLVEDAFKFATEAFVEMNSSSNLLCPNCPFPLPKVHDKTPNYYQTGCKLMNISDKKNFLTSVPYMYKNILLNIDEVQANLPLMIQFSDVEIMRKLSHKMHYDIWDESIRLLLKLRQGVCLNCGKSMDPEGVIEWKSFAIAMVQSINSTNALKLLQRYSKFIENGELDDFFYQYCIFATASNSKLWGVFDEESTQNQLRKSVGRYLQQRFLNDTNYDSLVGVVEIEPANCDYCQLPLRIPIIDEFIRLDCNHCYHKVCFLYNKCCFVCNSVP